MKEREFKGMIHYLHKRMQHITFPTTKQEILDQVGTLEIKTSFKETATISTLVAPIPLETFSCFSQFYCALLSSLS